MEESEESIRRELSTIFSIGIGRVPAGWCLDRKEAAARDVFVRVSRIIYVSQGSLRCAILLSPEPVHQSVELGLGSLLAPEGPEQDGETFEHGLVFGRERSEPLPAQP
jgi:hypothetical protein